MFQFDVVSVPWVWLWVGAIFAVVVGIVLGLRTYRWWRSYRASRRSRSGNRAEQLALRLLAHNGYRIVESRPEATAHIVVNGRRMDGALRGDWLVKRDGRQFVAEVKSTERAADPALPETRRQLLEYWLCRPDCGLLLVDTDSMRVYEIRFEYRR
ncbi:MAG: hypothetical protein HUU55_09325 [Myxococcales bacterium]|nr:hypothetical protein [Myxococcales bacterium]